MPQMVTLNCQDGRIGLVLLIIPQAKIYMEVGKFRAIYLVGTMESARLKMT
jgi:hypothetical protein